jgi:hypothetical protein
VLLRRTGKYDSFLRISRALHLTVFDQPGKKLIFNRLPVGRSSRYVLKGEAVFITSPFF